MSRMLLLLSLLGAVAGCNTCQNCFDYAYPHYGSIAPRSDRNCGRVGSIFAPAGPDVGQLSPYKRETESVAGTGIKSYSDKDNDKKPTPAEEPAPEGNPLDNIDLPLTPADT